MIEFDFNDPAIREMVGINHKPRESWDALGRLVSMECEQCGNSWPCRSTLGLRAWRKKMREDFITANDGPS